MSDTPKLQLDEATGEMVSKSELKKRLQKRARAEAKTQARGAAAAAASTTTTTATAPGAEPAAAPKPDEPEPVADPDAMFKQGFLLNVFQERPEPPITRFPPEPNGFLHLGHAKAIAVNFGFARFNGGKTFLRYDDTNPEAEEEQYFLAIMEMIEWLGFSPHDITYASDNFQQLYDWAERLIERDGAYVCHCNEADIKLQRGGEHGEAGPRYRCAHADQSPATNLAKFRDMRDGRYEPQAAFLRMKQDITSGNPQMWDLAAYRVLKRAHHRTGDQWKIYPTYDFAHCLCDSIEGITHSLCTTEFILSRESYDWLVDALDIYKPRQWEYGRLNLNRTVMSKRALKRLVDTGRVRGWDDPRLYTLIALRRRGVPPGAILAFVEELGVSTAKTTIPTARFEQSIRRFLETSVPRLMLVLDPIPVVVEEESWAGLPAAEADLDVPFSPRDPAMGSHIITLTQTVYIDRSDFRDVDSPDYFRLAPGKSVGLLKVPYPIRATSFTRDAAGKVTEVRAVFDRESRKPKTYIQWVPEGSRRVEVRIHDHLFRSDEPASAEGGYLNDLNPDSETVYDGALLEPGFEEVRRRGAWPQVGGGSGVGSVRFQAMRIAYFAVDKDSTEDKVVLNRIVPLKEDSGKI